MEILYKPFNLSISYSPDHNSYISEKFSQIFAEITDKNKLVQKKSPAFFKILKEPILVQKKYIPHVKALILSFFVLDGQGCGIIMEAPHPPPIKVLVPFLSELVKVK